MTFTTGRSTAKQESMRKRQMSGITQPSASPPPPTTTHCVNTPLVEHAYATSCTYSVFSTPLCGCLDTCVSLYHDSYSRHNTNCSSCFNIPTSVWHADDDALALQVSDVVNHSLHARDERLTALKTKALGCSVPVWWVGTAAHVLIEVCMTTGRACQESHKG